MFERVESMALCWARREGREVVVWDFVWVRWERRAWPSFWRRRSFSGLGGMGGGARLVEEAEGMGMVRGSERRSIGGW